MAKIENKPASAYAGRAKEGAVKSVVTKPGNGVDKINMSVAGISKGNYAPEKTNGIKIRGTGAATKGTKARGPMA
jgi:hypothetical protein